MAEVQKADPRARRLALWIVAADTPVLVGDLAARRGRVLQGLAVLIAASGVGLGVALWRLFALLARAAAGA